MKGVVAGARGRVIRWLETKPPRRRKMIVILYYLAVIGVVALSAYFLYEMRLTGKNNIAAGQMADVVGDHARVGRWLLVVAFTQVLLIEAGVLIRGTGSEKDWLFWVHLAFALGYFAAVLLLNMSAFSGLRSLNHARLAYSAMLCYGVAAPLGLWMLFTRMRFPWAA